MKKTAKVFNEVNKGLGYIQDLNDKRNEEHQEPFLFLSVQRDEDGELPFLNVICSADDEVLEEMVLKVLEKEPEIRKVILKALKKHREKQCLKAIEVASEGLKKIAEMFNRPMPPKYPSGGIIAGAEHRPKSDDEFVVTMKEIKDESIDNFIERHKFQTDIYDEIFAIKPPLEIKCETPKSSGGIISGTDHGKNEVCLMEDEAHRIFKSSGKLKGDEDYSESEHPMLDYWNGQKIFFFENCCSNEIVLIENYDALRYALTKELIIYKFNLL